MKTQIIPAQITTVEDKIVGNLNMTQLFLLISPVLVMTGVYTLVPPTMKIVGYKVSIFLIFTLVSLGLALRIKGKVVINWLGIILSYNLRPKFYVFNKNEKTFRQMDLPIKKLMETKKEKVVASITKEDGIVDPKAGEILSFESLLAKDEIDFRIKSGKRGGVNVAFEQVKH